MKAIKIIALLLLCTGCTQLVETGNKANSAVRRTVYESTDKIQELVRYTPPPTQPQAPQVGYCYNTMTDIVCYEIPQPQLSNQMVGYQGMGNVMPANLPPPQDVQVLSTHEVMMQGQGGSATPFYIKEAPYVKADGEVVTSSKIMPIMPPPATAAAAPVALPVPAESHTGGSAGGPKRLMPRY